LNAIAGFTFGSYYFSVCIGVAIIFINFFSFILSLLSFLQQVYNLPMKIKTFKIKPHVGSVTCIFVCFWSEISSKKKLKFFEM